MQLHWVLFAVAFVLLARIGWAPTHQGGVMAQEEGETWTPTPSPTANPGFEYVPECIWPCLRKSGETLTSSEDAQEFLLEYVLDDCSDTGLLAGGLTYCASSCSVNCTSDDLIGLYSWANGNTGNFSDISYGIIRITNHLPTSLAYQEPVVIAPGGADPFFTQNQGLELGYGSSINFSFPLFERIKVKFNFENTYDSDQTNVVYLDARLDEDYDASTSVLTYFSNENFGHSYRTNIVDASDVADDGEATGGDDELSGGGRYLVVDVDLEDRISSAP